MAKIINTAMIYPMAMVRPCQGFFANSPRAKEAQVEAWWPRCFAAAGEVREEPDAGDGKPDLIAEHGGKKYVIEINARPRDGKTA